jgi:O-antigen ligase
MDIVVAARAIAASPIVGYGSWGRSSEVAQIDREVQRDYAERSNRPIEVSDHASRGHSQFLQSWTEGGVLGTAFFLVLGGMLLRSGAQVVLARHADSLTPSLLFWIGYALWSVAQSPFGERFSIAIPFACILGLELERKRKRTAHGLPARRPTASAHRFPTSRVERSQ